MRGPVGKRPSCFIVGHRLRLVTGRSLPFNYKRFVPITRLVDRLSLPNAFSPSAGFNRSHSLRIRLYIHRNGFRLSRKVCRCNGIHTKLSQTQEFDENQMPRTRRFDQDRSHVNRSCSLV